MSSWNFYYCRVTLQIFREAFSITLQIFEKVFLSIFSTYTQVFSTFQNITIEIIWILDIFTTVE